MTPFFSQKFTILAKRVLSVATAVFLLATGAQAAAAGEWTPLFNGRDTEGWIQRGGKAIYKVENGEIVGTAVAGTPNSFLCPPKNYADFELELEFKCDSELNSGVQIRSEAKKLKDREQPFGYQVEIDVFEKRARWWTGGIYDEGRRGWLFPMRPAAKETTPQMKEFTAQGASVTKRGEWNTLRILACGDSIQTFLNGTPRATLKDGMTRSGFIGLQVHSVGKADAGKQIRFRNIRIKEGAVTAADIPAETAGANDNRLTPEETAAGWQLLWNGKDSTGWRSVRGQKFPDKGWEMKNGILTILASGKGGDIITEKRYTDFELSLDFLLTPKANSGIKYYAQTGIDKQMGIGLEFQILDDKLNSDGKKLGGKCSVGSLYELIAPPAGKPLIAPGSWHNARIVARGGKIEHYLDGFKTVETDRTTDAFRELVKKSKYKKIPRFGEWSEGHILLQDHNDRVSYKNVKIRDLGKK